MVPILKSISFNFEPEYEDDFVIPGAAYIGVEKEAGVEYFYFRIMTPKRLIKILNEDKVIDGRATFIVNNFDDSLVEEQIKKILEDCIRPTWDEVAKAINRYMEWEYDNIKYETIEEAMKRINEELPEE